MKSWWLMELLGCIRKESAKEILGVVKGNIDFNYAVAEVNLFCPTHLKPTRASLVFSVHQKNMKLQFGNEKKSCPIYLHNGKTLLHLFNPTSGWHFSERFGLYVLSSLRCACLCPAHSRGGWCRQWECKLCFTLASLRDPSHSQGEEDIRRIGA